MGSDGSRWRRGRHAGSRGLGGPGRPHQRLLDVVQVGGHCPCGGIGIGRTERHHDGLVVASARSRVARVAPVRSRLTLPRVLMMRMNWARRKLPAASHTASWNSMSRVLNRSASAHGAAKLGEERLQARDLCSRDPLGGQPDVADLHDAPRLDDLGQGNGILGEHEVQVRDQLLGLQGGDVGSGALADLDHVHDRERPEGLPQDGPADVHRGGQLALGRELVPGPQALRPDQVQQAGRDLVREGAPVHHRELGPGRGAGSSTGIGRPRTRPRRCATDSRLGLHPSLGWPSTGC